MVERSGHGARRHLALDKVCNTRGRGWLVPMSLRQRVWGRLRCSSRRLGVGFLKSLANCNRTDVRMSIAPLGKLERVVVLSVSQITKRDE